MGFSDLLSSSRGPGIIGTLIALLVLGGFGALFMVFDKDMEKAGGKKIEAVVRDLGLELDGKKTQKESFEKLVAQSEPLKGQPEQIRELTESTQANATQIEELKAKIEEGEAAFEAAEKDWEDYKIAYRKQVWAEAKGQEFPEIKGAKSGTVYPQGKILSVSHTGISTMNSTGNKMIPREDVPADLQDRYQLTEEGAKETKEAEDDDRNKHFENVELAQKAEQIRTQKQKLKELDAKANDLNGKVQDAKENAGKFHAAINRKKGEIRAQKGKPLSRAPQMEQELRGLQAQEQANEASIGTNQRAAQEARTEASKLRDKIRELEDDFKKRQKEIMAKKAAEDAATGGAVIGAGAAQ